MTRSISVIVPTLNRLDDLLVFIESLCKQTIKPQELVVVDAGTIDDLQSQLQDALNGSGIDLQYARSEAGTSLQRNVAIKVTHFPDDKEGVQRFMMEASILAPLDHPNIIRVFDFGQSNGLMFLVTISGIKNLIFIN